MSATQRDRPERARTAARSATGATLALTAPGALLLVLGLTVLGGLLDGLFRTGYGVLTGLCFACGCVLAAAKTRPRDLLPVAVTLPLLFALGVAGAEMLRGWGSGHWVRSETATVALTLASHAPWLLSGTTVALVIAAARELAGRHRLRRATQRRR